MKTAKKSIIAIAVAAVCSIFLFTACKPHHQRGSFALDYVAEVLDLTEIQQKELDSIRGELEDKIKTMHGDKEMMHTALKEQLASEHVDQETIKEIIAEHRSRMDEVIDLAVERLTVFHAGLSPEQRQKLVSKLEMFEKHHHGRFYN